MFTVHGRDRNALLMLTVSKTSNTKKYENTQGQEPTKQNKQLMIVVSLIVPSHMKIDSSKFLNETVIKKVIQLSASVGNWSRISGPPPPLQLAARGRGMERQELKHEIVSFCN